jgi:carbonic anhydrase
MTTLDTLIERNQDFASHHFPKNLPLMPTLRASYFGVGKEELKAKAVGDPRAAVAVDVAALKVNPALPANWLVSGLVYDVTTGLVDVVVPPASLK